MYLPQMPLLACIFIQVQVFKCTFPNCEAVLRQVNNQLNSMSSVPHGLEPDFLKKQTHTSTCRYLGTTKLLSGPFGLIHRIIEC